MLFFSAILLSLVQFAFLAEHPNDPCFYNQTYCLNRDGSTKCTAETVARVTFRADHKDEAEHLSMSLLAYHSKGQTPVSVSLSFNIKGMPYNFFCSSDGDETFKPMGPDAIWATYDFRCNWKLILTASGNPLGPVTNSSISIDLATIDDDVPITLGFQDIRAVVAPNLKEILVHRLSYLECFEENRMSFTDNDKMNRVMMMKKVYNKEMEIFIYGLAPDTKSIDRSVKFINADGVSLTVSCNKSFGSLTGIIEKGDKKESIDKLFTFKSLDGYRCGFKIPLMIQTNNIKFDFNSRPIDFSFISTSGSTINKSNLKFHTDAISGPNDLSRIDWDTYDAE